MTNAEQRFNANYPRSAGHFAQTIDNYSKFPQLLIDDFSRPEKMPHIAISVDMLDTGIDVPEVANLVFFKPVYSKIKFWQMIGRGTRPCPDLFGPGQKKQDFRIFDFCFNFEFFKENPEGISSSDSPSLNTRLFRTRVQMLGHLQETLALDPLHDDAALQQSLTEGLHRHVAEMNRKNFIVRRHLDVVEPFQQRARWDQLSEDDLATLQHTVATLPTELPSDDIDSRQFDMRILRMQLALTDIRAGGSADMFNRQSEDVIEIASLLEEKSAIPDVARQLAYLAHIQEHVFWEDIDLTTLEGMRLRLRGLVPLLDKQKRDNLYTTLEDQVRAVHELSDVVYMPKITHPQYAKLVKAYLHNHLHDPVIHRLRTNGSLDATDLAALQQTLIEIGDTGEETGGETGGETLLATLLERDETTSLTQYVLRSVGMDRTAAEHIFAPFRNTQGVNAQGFNAQGLTTAQHRFIDMLIDQLTTRGFLDPADLFDAPFTSIHAGGPEMLFAGKESVIAVIVETISNLGV
ncbi:MAG: type I restriction-modification enzyme R subunit C-terminal domain-containing protein [Chloroflexota bacterium]